MSTRGGRGAPSRGDKKGVQRSRMHAAWNSPGRTETFKQVRLSPAGRSRGWGKTREEREVAWFACAFTRDDPPPEIRGGRGGWSPDKATHIDLAFVHVSCRCGFKEISIRADLVTKGYTPRCGPHCSEDNPAWITATGEVTEAAPSPIRNAAARTCKGCGAELEPHVGGPGKGRPRLYCTDCRDYRPRNPNPRRRLPRLAPADAGLVAEWGS